MVHNGDDVATVLSKKGTYKTKKVSDLPYSVDWDAAEALQKSKVVKKPNEIINMSVPTKGTTWTQETVTTKSFKSVEDALATKIDAPRFYTEAQAQKYQKLMQDKEIMGVVDSAQNLMETMLTKIDEAFGTAMQKGTPDGYLKHALTPERQGVLNQNKLNFEKMDSSRLKGNVNEFTGRQYKNVRRRSKLCISRQNKKIFRCWRFIPRKTSILGK